MKKILFTILLSNCIFADPINETLLETVKAIGTTIFVSCILTPPVDPTGSQQAMCAGLYATYIVKEQALNTPLPLMLAKDPSPYVWSPFDICRFETGHLIFGNKTEVPYCPTVSM